MNLTPLRYPGGKSIMTNFLNSFIIENQMSKVNYAEPYAGGAGAGINLLLNNKISKLFINDANPAIYSFWYSLINYHEDFLRLFDETNVNLEEWHIQKEKFTSRLSDFNCSKECILELGYSTFFLNRCNRSGILNAGPIGGKSKTSQNLASYKINARFNKKQLRERINLIILKKNDITVSNYDAIIFIEKEIKTLTLKNQKNTLVYLDPPYYVQGSGLYLNYYKHDDHVSLSKYLIKKKQFKWILSYDNVLEIRNLYKSLQQYKFDLVYTADSIKLGNELVVHSKNCNLPKERIIRKKKGKTPEINLVKIETDETN